MLHVKVPRLEEEDDMDADWAKVNSSLRQIWDQTPEGAESIRRVLDAIANLRRPASSNDDGSSP